ncbi:neuropeptide-like 3 [Periplaneta americana]|uniref:neuropeptide-like 3 n=1 Tax=Periplaneta americana TaxID=6978 RepID=UPI0037E829F0
MREVDDLPHFFGLPATQRKLFVYKPRGTKEGQSHHRHTPKHNSNMFKLVFLAALLAVASAAPAPGILGAGHLVAPVAVAPVAVAAHVAPVAVSHSTLTVAHGPALVTVPHLGHHLW